MAQTATVNTVNKAAEPESGLVRFARLRPRWLTLNWLGVLPLFIFILAFQIIPVFPIVVGAFTDDKNNLVLDNLVHLGDQLYRNTFSNSIQISLLTTFAGGLIGFMLAWAVTIGGLPRSIRGPVLSFCGVASNFAGVPLALAFIAAIGRSGTLTQALKSIGIFLYPDFKLTSVWGICLAYTYFQIPLMVLVMTPAFDGLRREWHEAADNLGASQTQYWRLVALPILLPSLLSALALLFANAFGAYATASALVGGGAGESLVVSILVRAQFSNDSTTNPHLGYALAFGMVVVVAITVTIYTWSRGRAERWRQSSL